MECVHVVRTRTSLIGYFFRPIGASGGKRETLFAYFCMDVVVPSSAPTTPVAHSKTTKFSFLAQQVLGYGACGKVELGVLHVDGSFTSVAVKTCEGYEARVELRVLAVCRHVFIVKLLGYAKQNDRVHLFLEPCCGGDLYFRVHFGAPRDKCTGAEWAAHARFYLAEVVCALAYLHARGIAHGDVKAENVLIDAHGHVQLADFGSAVKFTKRGGIICGSRGSELQHAPEMVSKLHFSLATEIWSLGCLAFELVTRTRPQPFTTCASHANMLSLLFAHTDDTVAANFVSTLLQVDASARPVIEDVKRHAFFSGIEWGVVEQRTLPVPWVPSANVINVEQDIVDMALTGVDASCNLVYAAV